MPLTTGEENLERAIAIVGIGGVFPGARSASEFWTNVLTQADCIRDIPRERFDAGVFYDSDAGAEDTSYCRVAGVVGEIPLDPRELRMPPVEAMEVDRLQLLALAAAREALHGAGYDSRTFDGSRTAVIFGEASGRTENELTSGWRVQHRLVEAILRRRLDAAGVPGGEVERALDEFREELTAPLRPLTPHTLVSVLPNVAAGRVASTFDLHGPNYVVDSGCSSTLAALDQAVEGLLSGEFDLAVTGGCHANLHPLILVALSKIGVLSSTRCRPFDAAADGFVLGEGAGVFVAKRLEDAVRNEDRIYAVIRGIGSSSDGRTDGVRAPSPGAQARAIGGAFAAAGYRPDTLQFVETDAAGTPLADRAEIEGMLAAYGRDLRPQQRIFLGAVKSHVGHLMGAAGAAGLVATILGLHHEVMPPILGCERPNPEIPWADLPFALVTEPTLWPPNVEGLPRRAGVSSLNARGPSFHAVVEAFDPAFHSRASTRRPRRRREAQEPVAIVGVASLLPDAETVEDFWTNLLERRYSVAPLPEGRFEGDRSLFVDRERKNSDTSYTDLGSTVPPPELDPALVGTALDELDPDQLPFLVCAARALADAGYVAGTHNGARVAIVAGETVGCRHTVWDGTLRLNALRAADAVARSSVLERVGLDLERREGLAAQVRSDLLTGRPPLTEDAVLARALQLSAARLSEAFGWTGLSLTVDAACASGLGALAVAVNGLRTGRWDLVATGSSSGDLLPAGIAVFAQTTALSATGSRPLSRSADGLVLGEGTVVFVLKRLRDALRAEDRIYAVIRGVGASSDGKGRALMAPNSDGQALAISRAWEDAAADPSSVQFVECHATGTRLGDEVEIESMRRVFGGTNGRRIGIGSVKSQIGHLGGGAAGPSLLKAAMGLYHRTLPPTLVDGEPLETLTEDGTPFALVTEPRVWPENLDGEPRRAAVSSFGFGGTDFHAVLEEFDPAYHRRLLQRRPGAEPTSLRLPADAVAFLFPGQGAWQADMLRDLYEAHGVVRETFEEANDALRPLLGETLEQILFTDPRRTARDVDARLLEGPLAQPALVAANVALERLLRSFGVAPHVLAGHSLGEYSALVAAGVMGLGDALAAAYARARALRAVAERGDAGRMAAVRAGEAEVREVLGDVPGYVAVANLNSPSQTVISGESDAVEEALRRLGGRGIDGRRLPLEAAFHSRLTRPGQADLAAALEKLSFALPRIPVLSTVTADFVPPVPEEIRAMLVDQLCAPVDFMAVVRRLYEEGVRTFVEVGPKRVLTPFVDETLDGLEHAAVSVSHPNVAGPEQLARALDLLRARGLAAAADVQPTRGLVAKAADALKHAGFPLEHGRVPRSHADRTAVIYADLATRVDERARLEAAMRATDRLRRDYLDKVEQAASDGERLAADRWFAAEQAAIWGDLPDAEDGESPAALRIAEAIGAGGPAFDLDAHEPAACATAVAGGLVDAGLADAVLVFSGSERHRAELQCAAVGRPAAVAPPAAPEPPPAPPMEAEPPDAVAEEVLEAFSEATGYERELLGLDLDLEAELGIDTIKQAQILAQLAERFGLPLDPEQFRPGDFPTLRHVIEFAAAHAPRQPASAPEPAAAAPAATDARVAQGVPRILRFAVSSGPAPLAAEQPNLTIGAGWNVLVVGSSGPATDALVRALAGRGARVARAAPIASDDPLAGLRRELEATRARDGPFDGVVYLHEGSASAAAPAKAAFHALQVFAGDLRAAAGDRRAFVAAVGPPDPDGAAVTGVLKSAAKELRGVVVKAIGLEADSAASLTETVLSEIELGGTRVEVGWSSGERRIRQVAPLPLERLDPVPPVDASSVLLVVGGGRGITAEIAKQLARSFQPTFVVWGTSVLDDESLAAADLDDEGLRRLRQECLERARAKQPDAPPRVLDEEFRRLLRAVETQRTLQRLVELGSRAEYRTVDVRNIGAVASAVQALLTEHGRLDGVVFAAGTIEDKLLEDKQSDSFDRVFDVKARGLPNLARALAGSEPRFFAAFSSVVGVFGNRGQADYAAANAFVDRFIAIEGARRSGRWFSVAWGPWADVGLAARSGSGPLAADRGLALISPSEGAEAFELELLHGNEPMIVLGGRLDVLDEDGAVGVAGGMFDDVRADGEDRIVATRTFTLERDPWLADHVIAGVPIIPGVLEVELLVQAASELMPGRRFAALENLILHRAVKLLRGEPATVRVRAESDGGGAADAARVRVALESTAAGPDGSPTDRVHCEALVELAGDGPPHRPAHIPATRPASVVARPDIYAPRGPLPLGPALQVLERVRLNDSLAIGEVGTPSASGFAHSGWPTVAWGREAAVQTAGLHAIVRHGIAALPAGCRRLEHFGEAPPGLMLRTEAYFRGVKGDEVEYDINLVGADGKVYDRMIGYRAVRLRTFP